MITGSDFCEDDAASGFQKKCPSRFSVLVDKVLEIRRA